MPLKLYVGGFKKLNGKDQIKKLGDSNIIYINNTLKKLKGVVAPKTYD